MAGLDSIMTIIEIDALLQIAFFLPLASHTAFRNSLLFSRSTGLFASLFVGKGVAYPELDQKNGKPCSFLEDSAQEEAFAAAGQGYRHMPTRALNERSGDGGVPEGGFAAVEADLISLMTDSQPEWPADDFGGGQVSYAGYVAMPLRGSVNGLSWLKMAFR